MPRIPLNDEERDFRARLGSQLAEAAALRAAKNGAPPVVVNNVYVRILAGTKKLFNDVLGERSNF